MKAKTIKKLYLTPDNLNKWGTNLLKFTAPTLVIFFTQLALGVSWKIAGSVALLALYQATADYLKKYQASKG